MKEGRIGGEGHALQAARAGQGQEVWESCSLVQQQFVGGGRAEASEKEAGVRLWIMQDFEAMLRSLVFCKQSMFDEGHRMLQAML